MPLPTRDVFFAPYHFDAETGRLRKGVGELAIRPKTAAVLRHLTDHPGRIVTVAELVHAVWADSAGSAPLVKGCVRELRKLLGDDRATPRYVETVGRRGYRFVAPLHAATESATAWASDGREPHFVGRRRELDRLEARLEAVLAGTRQVLFVGGEPGIGKTTLVQHFLLGAAARHELRIGRGQCVEGHGAGEPYLPVLQALAATCRTAGADVVVDVLERYAPTWRAQMPALLAADERERGRRAARGDPRDRVRMVRELCEAAVALAAERPLVLWLDDLQWSDPSTIELLVALALGVAPARLLVVGTHRPAEVVVSGHPLGAARKSLLARGQADDVTLGALAADDVERYVARRFPAHALPPEFAAALVELTDGHPFFLAAALDELVAAAVIVQRDGTWRLERRVAELADLLPASARHAIERQVERLGDEDQRILDAASVAGREFSAGGVAAALGLEVDAVDERLQALASVSHLVQARGLDAPPRRATSGRYAFAHALQQRVLYGRLGPARRARLHRRLGEAQQRAWDDRSDEIAAELAAHFEHGGDARRAIRFARAAAENAAQRLATTEAIAHLSRGLQLVTRLSRRERPAEEIRLQMALGLMLMNGAPGAAEAVGRAYRRAADVAARVANRADLYRMLRGLHRVILIRGDMARALTLARKGVAMARRGRDADRLLEAELALGVSLFYTGELGAARAALRRCLRRRDGIAADSPVLRMLDPAIVVHAHLAFVAALSGDGDAAHAQLDEMRRRAHDAGQGLALAYAQLAAAMLHQFAGDPGGARAEADALLAGSTPQGFALFGALARTCRGWARAVGERREDGVQDVRAALAHWRATGAEFLVPYQLGVLSEAEAALGMRAPARASVAEALAVARRTGERWRDPGLRQLARRLRPPR